MSHSITARVDSLIEEYRKDHHGELPLYIIISPDDADRLVGEIRHTRKYDPNTIITNYRDIHIAKHDMFSSGKIILSNELPETGS
jgi:hypothetical protein